MGAQKSREIEKLIRQDEKRMSKEVKLLLLGELLPQLLMILSCPPPTIAVSMYHNDTNSSKQVLARVENQRF